MLTNKPRDSLRLVVEGVEHAAISFGLGAHRKSLNLASLFNALGRNRAPPMIDTGPKHKIPVEWLRATGMLHFKPSRSSYRCEADGLGAKDTRMRLIAILSLCVFAACIQAAGAQTNPCEEKHEGDVVGCNVANQLLVCRETAKGIFAPEPDPNSKCEVRIPKTKQNAPKQKRTKARPSQPAAATRSGASANCRREDQVLINRINAFQMGQCAAAEALKDEWLELNRSARCSTYLPNRRWHFSCLQSGSICTVCLLTVN